MPTDPNFYSRMKQTIADAHARSAAPLAVGPNTPRRSPGADQASRQQAQVGRAEAARDAANRQAADAAAASKPLTIDRPERVQRPTTAAEQRGRMASLYRRLDNAVADVNSIPPLDDHAPPPVVPAEHTSIPMPPPNPPPPPRTVLQPLPASLEGGPDKRVGR